MFPDLTLDRGDVLHASASGVPENGPNTFDLGISLRDLYGDRHYDVLENPDQLDIDVSMNGPSITGAALVSVVGTKVTINFTQAGVDGCLVQATVRHSVIR